MNTETLKIAALRAPPRNVRSHPEKQIVELVRAVEMFGQTRPVVIDENNTVLAGNGLVAACKRLGMTDIAAYRVTGLSDAAKRKLMLSDNRIFQLGFDDHAAILDTIRSFEGDLDIPGFDSEVLKNLAGDAGLVTEAAMGGYGILPDAAIAAARENELPPPVEGGAPAPPEPEPEVICPNCGRGFAP